MNVLILGKGYIGSHLLNTLSNNHFVQIIRRGDVDYANRETFLSFLKTNDPDIIINCSGYTGYPNVDGCETNKQDCWFYNVVAPLNVLQVAEMLDKPVFHVSSGCIYSGYDKEYTEQDEPNFGLFNAQSSYYSKTKHAFETISQNYNSYIFRIRMPFDSTTYRKNYLYKLYKYNTLISSKNSLTSVQDLSNFIGGFILNYKFIAPGIFNVVNPGGVDAKEIIDILKKNGIVNPQWQFIDTADLKTVANRSNCVLDCSKIQALGLGLPDALTSLNENIKQLAQKI